MPLTIDLGVAELAATRFAMSPLGETVSGLQLLGFGNTDPFLRPWLRWAQREIRRAGLALPTAWPLLVEGRTSFPEFLLPSPNVPEPDLEDELARMRRTRAAQVRASIGRVFGTSPPSAVAEVAATPAASLRVVATELHAAYELLVAPHWPRLRAVLAADIAYRARQLAIGGAQQLFKDLHRELRFDAGRITLTGRQTERAITLGERGLVLVPSVLTADMVKVKLTTSTQTTLRYPARGAATLWTTGLDAPGTAIVRLVGAPRARVLAAVRSPATTSGLAATLGVTPSAVSQHLAVLRASGLVRSERAGRSVLHLATDLGLSLLDPE